MDDITKGVLISFGIIAVIGAIVLLTLFFGTSVFDSASQSSGASLVASTGDNPPGDNNLAGDSNLETPGTVFKPHGAPTGTIFGAPIGTIKLHADYTEANLAWTMFIDCLEKESRFGRGRLTVEELKIKKSPCPRMPPPPVPLERKWVEYIACLDKQFVGKKISCSRPRHTQRPGQEKQNTFIYGVQ